MPRLNFYYPGVNWLEMTTGYAHWHLRRLEPLIAERQLDAAVVAGVPQMREDRARHWYHTMQRIAARSAEDWTRRSEVLTVNGVVVAAKRIRAALSNVLDRRLIGG